MKPYNPKPATETTEEATEPLSEAGFSEENATILSAMEYLTRGVETDDPDNTEDGTVDQTECEANAYLQQRLSLTHRQVVVLTASMYANARNFNGFRTVDLAQLLGLRPLQAMGLESELDTLQDLGYINQDGPGHRYWQISDVARKALVSNRDYSQESLRLHGNVEFLQAVNGAIKEGMRHDSDGAICKTVDRLMKINRHLPVVRNLSKLEVSNLDRWALLLMMATLGGAEDDFVNSRDLEQGLRTADVRSIVRAIHQGTYVFVQKGYLEPYADDGFAKADGWVLSRKAWTEMLESEEEAASMIREEGPIGNLTPFGQLKQRNLYFSDGMQQQVDRLRDILTDERYLQIRTALDAKGLPKGFCCLFYGTPGTGKTELVQQLAIQTGRDLMQVDVSQLRDKYVGESEKRLKAVFDNYRRTVHRTKKAPILFFNEADAIFGNRMERTERSVDKMENAMQNIILQEMETLDGIMICTTNLTSTLDKAFERRFLYKIEFDRPNADARKHIWLDMIADLSDEQAQHLADRYDFSGGQIQNISRKQIIQQIFTGEALDYPRLLEDCNSEKLSRSNGRRVGF